MAEPTVIDCSVAACTVTVQYEAAPLTPETAEDLVSMFWDFVLVLVLVWGVKQILNIFTANPNES
jgi:flagellar biogenesis protein FliO